MFRTHTGQIGKDAYLYELAQIRNARRELLARERRLAAILTDELLGAPDVRKPIPSERFPDATVPCAAMHAGDCLELGLLDEAEEIVRQLPTDWAPSWDDEPTAETVAYIAHNRIRLAR